MVNKQLKLLPQKILKINVLIDSKQMSCGPCKAALASDWLAFFSSMAQTKITPCKGEKGKPGKVRTRAEVHALSEPPVLEDPPVPEMETPPIPQEIEKRIAEWGGHQSHCWPNSWPRWLQRMGHLLQAGRSWPWRSSDLPFEARPPGRNSSRPGRWKSPRGTTWGWSLSARSANFRKVQISSFTNYPFHI